VPRPVPPADGTGFRATTSMAGRRRTFAIVPVVAPGLLRKTFGLALEVVGALAAARLAQAGRERRPAAQREEVGQALGSVDQRGGRVGPRRDLRACTCTTRPASGTARPIATGSRRPVTPHVSSGHRFLRCPR
jgi:hypothetical protein